MSTLAAYTGGPMSLLLERGRGAFYKCVEALSADDALYRRRD